MKRIIARIKQSKFTSIFFMFGIMISMLILSVAISFVSEVLEAQHAKEEAMPPHGVQFGLYRSDEKEMDYEILKNMFTKLPQGMGVIVNQLMVHLDQSEVNVFSSISAETFGEDDLWHYPIIEGRYYSVKEMQEQKKVALIGKSLLEYVVLKEGKKYIDIEGETYEVLGIVGLKNQLSLWDNRIFMPFSSLPQKVRQSICSSNEINFILYSIETKAEEMVQNLSELIDANGTDMLYEEYGEIQVEDVMENVVNSQDQIFTIALLGYIVALIYAINIVIFWIEKRRYEIAVCKAVGYTNQDVVKMIYSELLGLIAIGCASAIMIQAVIGMLTERVAGYTVKIYASNILVSIAITCFSAMIISIVPIYRALKIQPAVAVKEGENDV